MVPFSSKKAIVRSLPFPAASEYILTGQELSKLGIFRGTGSGRAVAHEFKQNLVLKGHAPGTKLRGRGGAPRPNLPLTAEWANVCASPNRQRLRLRNLRFLSFGHDSDFSR